MESEHIGINVTLEYIKRDIAEIKEKLDQKYVSKEEFEPIKRIVYGLVGIVLTGVVVSIINVVVK